MKRLLAGLVFLCSVLAVQAADFENERRNMVHEVKSELARTSTWIGMSALSPAVVAAMGKVERHRFVPEKLADLAYRNRPLPIGHGQTISQPYIVALMSELLRVRPGDRVLEIGTGSGYQAAILAELGASVFSIEIVEELGREAAARLASLGYHEVRTRIGDGYYGWPEAAPFDAIMVTAAASHVPPPLVRQLQPGGRMVIPLGMPFMAQSLMLVEKNADGSLTSYQILPVSFVPLTGGH